LNETNGGGIDEVQVAGDELAEGRFGAVLHKFSEQCQGLGHVFSSKMPPEGKSRHEFQGFLTTRKQSNDKLNHEWLISTNKERGRDDANFANLREGQRGWV
jgi:hypothetical protein